MSNRWRDAPYVSPTTIDEARHQMTAELLRAVHGDVWERPEPVSEVWFDLLKEVDRWRRDRLEAADRERRRVADE